MRAAFILGGLAIVTGCNAAHIGPGDAGVDSGPDPRTPCDGPVRCAQCCQDPDTGYRYCCSFDYTYTDEEGVDVYLCGEGPACVASECCADARAFFAEEDFGPCSAGADAVDCDSYAHINSVRRFPPGELPDGSGEEWGPLIGCTSAADCRYDCCSDPDTGERYCCDFDRTTRRSDGSTVRLCGAGPPCPNNAHCCAEQSARFPPPTGIRRCTYNVAMCEWAAMIP